MSLTLLDVLLWAAGSLLNAVLLCMLLFRRRYQTLPWFTAWIAHGSLLSLLLYLASRWWTRRVYGDIYWTGAFLDMLFQVAVVLEIGRLVLRRRGRWVEGARARLSVMGTGAAVLAVLLAITLKPPAITGLSLWTTRGNLFTTILVCTLFTGVVATSQQLGLGWRTHAMRVGYGLTVWALTGMVVDILHGYFGPHHEKIIDQIEMVVFVGALLYWLGALWPAEPERRPITEAEINRVTALRSGLEYRPTGTTHRRDGAIRR